MSPPALDTTGVIDVLDADVRSEVRRHGVDPQLDVDAVRRMAVAAVRAHDQASLSGVVRPVDEPDSVVDELVLAAALGEDDGVIEGAADGGWRRPRPGFGGGALVVMLTT